MKTILIATTNSGKIQIYEPVFKNLKIDVVSLKSFDDITPPEKNGADVIENAVIKAKYYHEITKLPVLANDSGLFIDKLSAEEQPGVFIRRFGDKELTDQEIINIYIEKLNRVGGSSPAHYEVGLAIIDESGNLYTKLFKPQRFFVNKSSNIVHKGIPLSSLSFDEKTGKYLSEMTFDERNKYEGKEFLDQIEFIKEIFFKSL